VAGKGGVGKTVIAGCIAWSLARDGVTTLAIDADSAPNLALSLGLSPDAAARIVPVSEDEGLIRRKTDTGFEGVYNLNFSVDDIVRDFSVATPAGVHLLVMGTVKSMGAGCACPGNNVVRALLRHLVVERDEAVVLDMEAGLEHLGRGTAEAVDWMLIVGDANRKSLLTAAAIAGMARGAGIAHVALVGNRVEDDEQAGIICAFARGHDLPLQGLVPFDAAVARSGIRGGSVLDLDGTAAYRAIEQIVRGLTPAPREGRRP